MNIQIKSFYMKKLTDLITDSDSKEVITEKRLKNRQSFDEEVNNFCKKVDVVEIKIFQGTESFPRSVVVVYNDCE